MIETIKKTEAKIEVEVEIKACSDAIDKLEAKVNRTDDENRRLNYLHEEKKSLRKKEESLRKEKEDLREKEKRLSEKEERLRELEERLMAMPSKAGE